MAVIPAPDFRIRSIEWTLDRPAQVNVSAYTGRRKAVANPWHGKWRARVEMAPLVGSQMREMRAFFASLRGRVNTFYLPATEGPQHAGGLPSVASGGVQGSTSMTLGTLLGAELVTNGGFASTANWTPAGSSLSLVGGRLRVTNTSPYGSAHQAVATEVGKTYRIGFDRFRGTADQAHVRVGFVPGESNNADAAGVSDVTGGHVDFVATHATTFITLLVNSVSVGAYSEFDNISLREVVGGTFPDLKAGMFATVTLASGAKQLLVLTENINSWVITFEPPLREAVANGTSVETINPFAEVAMAEDITGWRADLGPIYGVAFDVEEAF